MTAESGSAPLTLADVLAAFETRSEPFDPHEVAEAVRALGKQIQAGGEAVTLEIRAEWLAFTLMENYRGDDGFAWGTYYGPVGVFRDAKGTRIEAPPIEEITPDVIAYWEERASTARHPAASAPVRRPHVGVRPAREARGRRRRAADRDRRHGGRGR